ncbi:MAG: transport permease protein [Leptospiraceae bacterium]|nr:MAG: transport permease protein [Leptospiraceae bacterium]
MRFLLFVVPVVQMFLYGYAIKNEVRNYPTGISDLDRSYYSRLIKQKLEIGEYFKIYEYYNSDELYFAINKNKIKLAIIIPSDFSKKINSFRKSYIQILLDGTDATNASIALGYFNTIISQIPDFKNTVSFNLSFGNNTNTDFYINLNNKQLIELQERIWYNPELESKYFFVPAIITFLLTLIIILLTALSITKEKEQGTWEQIKVSPITGIQFILGKSIPFLLIGMIMLILTTLFSYFGFRIPFHGSILQYFVFHTIYIFAMIFLGLFISSISNSQGQAVLTTFGLLFPFLILSDFFFPIKNMPYWIQKFNIINPLVYSVHFQRKIFLKGISWLEIYHHLIFFSIFIILFSSLSIYKLRK